ncbi:uncharacterized protein EV422DRAFT_506381 [Fimicolochytrium jonesii]|uniref:uncharacterized protein n=1 Tax=Fimicolochytrium jonesii TaxID=1396493 RepID=UPI0022FF2858|nr:uncharacterized protein EV422DRAFT_506381 [Fimicolochytrium jonesii]KAI8820627.1 hypothetical protein EV422DRAFT_506381 [Fimicolochytrium jonesii]
MSVAPETIRTMEKERQEQKAPLEPAIDNKDLDTHPTDDATPDDFDPEFAPELDYGDHPDICADENDDSMSDDGEMFQRQRSDNDDSFEEEQESHEGDEGREGNEGECEAKATVPQSIPPETTRLRGGEGDDGWEVEAWLQGTYPRKLPTKSLAVSSLGSHPPKPHEDVRESLARLKSRSDRCGSGVEDARGSLVPTDRLAGRAKDDDTAPATRSARERILTVFIAWAKAHANSVPGRQQSEGTACLSSSKLSVIKTIHFDWDGFFVQGLPQALLRIRSIFNLVEDTSYAKGTPEAVLRKKSQAQALRIVRQKPYCGSLQEPHPAGTRRSQRALLHRAPMSPDDDDDGGSMAYQVIVNPFEFLPSYCLLKRLFEERLPPYLLRSVLQLPGELGAYKEDFKRQDWGTVFDLTNGRAFKPRRVRGVVAMKCVSGCLGVFGSQALITCLIIGTE